MGFQKEIRKKRSDPRLKKRTDPCLPLKKKLSRPRCAGRRTRKSGAKQPPTRAAVWQGRSARWPAVARSGPQWWPCLLAKRLDGPQALRPGGPRSNFVNLTPPCRRIVYCDRARHRGTHRDAASHRCQVRASSSRPPLPCRFFPPPQESRVSATAAARCSPQLPADPS